MMGALHWGTVTISFQNLFFGVFQGNLQPIKSIIGYLIKATFWLLGQYLRLEQQAMVSKVEIYLLDIFCGGVDSR
jgi:hypothetical protein